MSASYLLVGNPTARTGKAAKQIDQARELLLAEGGEVTVLATAPSGETTPLVRDALRGAEFDAVLAMGGDGTFSEVAAGILQCSPPPPMGFLPAGTANDQARSFGLPLGPGALRENVAIVMAGHLSHLDAGRIARLTPSGEPDGEAYFFDSVGWGMQPEILAVRNRDRRLVDQIPVVREVYRDQAVYVGAALNRYLASWVEPTKFSLEAVVDGKTQRFDNLTDLILCGTPVYAGSWVLDRESEPDDGLFELVPIQGRRDWFVKAMKDLATISHLRDNLDMLGITSSEVLRGSRFELRLTRPQRPEIATQLDGDEWLRGQRFRVEVLPQAIQLFTPAGFSPPWKTGDN